MKYAINPHGDKEEGTKDSQPGIIELVWKDLVQPDASNLTKFESDATADDWYRSIMESRIG